MRLPDDQVGVESLTLAPGLRAAELHSHTLASDGMVSAAELVTAAAAIGLSALCITDHDTISDLAAATELGRQLGVDVVRGEEVTTAWPMALHVIALFIERPIRMGMSLPDTVDAVHDNGGLVILPHPFMPTYFASIGMRAARRLVETHTVDGIELRHTAPVLPGTWARLDRFYGEHRERLGAAIGAGDSHFGRHDIGRWVTLFEGDGAVGLRRALEARTTSPFRGPIPPPPSWRLRIAQQRRALIDINRQRRRGLVGRGVGPR